MSAAPILIVEDEAIVAADLASKLAATRATRLPAPPHAARRPSRWPGSSSPALVLMDIRLAARWTASKRRK